MAKKKELPIAYAVVIGICALVLIGFFGYKVLGGGAGPQAPNSVDLHTRAEKLALKSGGDFSKLTPSEQKLLDNMTLGHGKKYVEINYARLSGSGGK